MTKLIDTIALNISHVFFKVFFLSIVADGYLPKAAEYARAFSLEIKIVDTIPG